MKTEIKINESNVIKDYFPSLFTNKDNTIVILADDRQSDKTFSGMIIHSGNNPKATVGMYSTGWTYSQFKRISKGSKLDITLTQDD